MVVGSNGNKANSAHRPPELGLGYTDLLQIVGMDSFILDIPQLYNDTTSNLVPLSPLL